MSGEQGMDRIRIKVRSIDGDCSAGHFVGEEILVDNLKLSSYVCPEALYAMWPMIQVLKFKGQLPWGDPDGIVVSCPDAGNLVRFEIRRVGSMQGIPHTSRKEGEAAL